MQQLRAGRSAILAPGGNYGADGPLLMYARLAVQRRGGQVYPIVWELSGDSDFSQERRGVASQVESAIDEMTTATGAAPVVIGKSLGSLAAPLVVDRGLAAVWFTPLLTDEPTLARLRRATGPCLLAGGTADQAWDGQAARLPLELSRSTVPITGCSCRAGLPPQLRRWARSSRPLRTSSTHIVWP